jgi:ActR/RegA family two-component response regulator
MLAFPTTDTKCASTSILTMDDNDPQAPTEPAASSGAPSLAVACVRALMERHGLPKYRQSPWLADALGLSYSQAHRRMTGASPWTLEDLAKVAALFGESLPDVVSHVQPRTSVTGVMNVGDARLPCELWIGEPLETPRPDAVVAVKTSSGWSAVPAREAQGVVYRIERLEARPDAMPRRTVAVLDDDQDLTDSICAHLEASGYDARPFYRTADLLSSAAGQHYDGYIVDWIVGEKSTLRLIGSLRAQDAKCPIVVLTAQVLSGVVDEAEIADAVKRYDLVFSEKPVRTSILAATLARGFAASE